MHVDIACQHTTLTDPLRQAVLEKFAKLDDHTDKAVAAHVVLRVEKDRHVAEATLTVQGKPLHAEASARGANGMYQAIDKLVARLDRAMRKAKTKKLQRTRGPVPSLRHALA